MELTGVPGLPVSVVSPSGVDTPGEWTRPTSVCHDIVRVLTREGLWVSEIPKEATKTSILGLCLPRVQTIESEKTGIVKSRLRCDTRGESLVQEVYLPSTRRTSTVRPYRSVHPTHPSPHRMEVEFSE